MPWPFRAKPKNSIFQIDRYKLGSPIGGLAELAEFSQSEYETMGRKFHGERNYNGPPVSFLGRPWKLMLGTVNGNIYKIAVYLELDGKQEALLIALACSDAPQGQAKWTARLLANRAVEMEIVESISESSVRRLLKKTHSSHGKSARGASRK